MSLKADEQDFARLFPDARRLERPVAIRNFRAGRRQFDQETPNYPEENCRKAMKLALYAAAYSWLLPTAFFGVPGSILLSFHSDVVVDILAAVFLIAAFAAYSRVINRTRRARSIYPGKVRASWAGFWPPPLPRD